MLGRPLALLATIAFLPVAPAEPLTLPLVGDVALLCDDGPNPNPLQPCGPAVSPTALEDAWEAAWVAVDAVSSDRPDLACEAPPASSDGAKAWLVWGPRDCLA